jgi:hypothetical protein
MATGGRRREEEEEELVRKRRIYSHPDPVCARLHIFKIAVKRVSLLYCFVA